MSVQQPRRWRRRPHGPTLHAVVLSSCLTVAAAQARADVPMVPETIDAASPSNPWAKQLADFDGDGDLDFAVGGNGGAVVWYRHPDWMEFEIDDTGVTESGGWVADLDGDGDPDLIIGSTWYENPRPAGDPTAGHWTAREFPGFPGCHDVRAGYIDGDDRLDVVIRGENSSVVSLFLQVAPGQWQRRDLDPGVGRNGLALADLDRDDRLDIVVPERWLKAPADPLNGPWTVHDYGTWGDYAAIEPADLDLDGWPDLVLTPSEVSGDIAWFENPQNPTSVSAWAEHTVDTGLTRAHSLVVGDLDLDGNLDLATSEFDGDQRLLIYFGVPGGGAWSRQIVGTPALHNVVGGDVDLDGDLDLAGTGTFGVTGVELWRNELLEGIFSDGFETGDTSAWSMTTP